MPSAVKASEDTRRSHPNDELEKFAFLESPAPLVVTQQRRILRCNRTFASLFGYTIDALEGEQIVKLYPCTADYYVIGERCMNVLQSNPTCEDERFMQHRDGHIFWARAHGITLTPHDPYEYMIWHFERIRHHDTRNVRLTPREQEISGYIVNGLTCKETAQKLGISHRTVEVHRARVMKKLGAKNTADLVSKIVTVSNID